MNKRDDRPFPSAAGARRKGRLQHRVLLAGSCPGALSEYAGEPVVATVRWPGLAYPSAFLITGQSPAHEARCEPDENCATSGPTSARMAAEDSSLMLGIVWSKAWACSNGSVRRREHFVSAGGLGACPAASPPP